MKPPISSIDNNKERILGQILTAQSILHALPPGKKLEEFVIEVIRSVPGVELVGLCLRGFSGPMGDFDEGCPDCSCWKNYTGDQLNIRCGFSGMENIWVLPLKTSLREYGFLQIRGNETCEMDQFKPIIKNFANVVTITMENQWQQNNLEALNAELKNHRNKLESVVAGRTSKINAQKEQLKNYAAELEITNEDMRHFIHIASHDLREPPYGK